MDEKKIELFESRRIPSAVATLAIPSVLGCLVMILYNVADTYFVGMLGDPIETAAVSLASPVILAFNAVTNLFGVGGSSMMSRCLGRHDYDTARRCVAFSFWLAFLCALLLAAGCTIFRPGMLQLLGADESTSDATSSYLFWTVTCGAVPAILNVVLSNMVRGEGSAFHASIGVMSGCLLNILLDPLFVLPRFLGMGAAGAGCATFISNIVAMSYLLIVIFIRRRTTCVCLNPRMFCLRRDIFREVFGVGVPASIQNLLNVTGSVILNSFTSVYGPDAVSAMGIAHKVSLLPIYISMGITQGVMPLISYNFTGGNRKRMNDTITFVLKLAVGITLSLAVCFYLCSGSLIRLFMDNDTIVAHGEILLRNMSLGIPFLGIDFLAVAVFQAIGKGKYSFIFAISRKILLEIPAIILLNKLLPLYGMGYAQPVAELVLAVAALFMLRKIYHMKQ